MQIFIFLKLSLSIVIYWLDWLLCKFESYYRLCCMNTCADIEILNQLWNSNQKKFAEKKSKIKNKIKTNSGSISGIFEFYTNCAHFRQLTYKKHFIYNRAQTLTSRVEILAIVWETKLLPSHWEWGHFQLLGKGNTIYIQNCLFLNLANVK